MNLRCIIIIVLCAVPVHGDVLDTLQRQFEIYQRYTGEIEILSGNNTQEIDNVLKRTAAKCLAVRNALDTQRNTAVSPPFFSPLLDNTIAKLCQDYITVERTSANRALQQGKPDEAMQSIQYVYRFADELSTSQSLTLRSAAAIIRLQILETVQSLLMNPDCRNKHHNMLYVLLKEQLNRKENDKMIWMRHQTEGERFFAETERNGLAKTVSQKLLNELLNRNALDNYDSNPAQRLHHDRSVFRHVMSAIIESCGIPYYRRKPIVQRLDKELQNQQGSPNEPVFAVLLLENVSEAMQLFAQEQSNLELAYLAINASLYGEPKRKTVNFLTGKEYEFHLIPGGISCTYEGNIKPFYVPHR